MKDANYRTEENPDSVAKVDNNHTYTYDANGNLVYVNTGRIKQDGALDSTAAERKLRVRGRTHQHGEVLALRQSLSGGQPGRTLHFQIAPCLIFGICLADCNLLL